MQFFKEFALVLTKEKQNEIDLVVTFLSKTKKFKAIAKGGQKSQKRFLNAFEDFTLLKLLLRKSFKTRLPIIDSAKIIFVPEKIREKQENFFFFPG